MLEETKGVGVVEPVKQVELGAAGRITQGQRISIHSCQNCVMTLKQTKTNLNSNYVILLEQF